MINDNSPTRQAQLKAWLILHNWDGTTLAKEMGISAQLLSMTLSGKRMTEERHSRLLSLGIPEELLPHVKPRLKRGPKPRLALVPDTQ